MSGTYYISIFSFSTYYREARTQLYKTVTTFIKDLYRKMGVRAVVLTAHVDENDQAHVSKYDSLL